MFALKSLRYLAFLLSIAILLLQAVWALGVYWVQTEYRFAQEKAKVQKMITNILYLKNVASLDEAQTQFKNDPELKRLKDLDTLYQQRDEALVQVKEAFSMAILRKSSTLDSLQLFILPTLYALLGGCIYFILQIGDSLRWHSKHPRPLFIGLWLATAAGAGASAGALLLPALSSTPPSFVSGSMIFLLSLALGFNSERLSISLKQHFNDYLHWLWASGHYRPHKKSR